MPSYSTSIDALSSRILDSIIDKIAISGLEKLKQILDSSGFAKSEYLKNYEVYSHITKNTITFEILVDVEATYPADKITEEAIEEDKGEIPGDRTYGIAKEGIRRITGAKDARVTSEDRLIRRAFLINSPRGLDVDKNGRLVITFKRSTKKVKEETVIPKNHFQGILDNFIKELNEIIINKFIPELGTILK